jgi:hypothetical protein
MSNPDFARFAFIDLEASGLGSNGFPTEIGWATIHEGGSIVSGACLIKPPAIWTMYANAWSTVSERLTGISREMLGREGLSPRDAMARFLEAVGDRGLLSDEPDFDAHWLGMLTKAAGTSIAQGRIGDARPLMYAASVNHIFHPGQDLRPRHRAEYDARRLALTVVCAAREGTE